MSSGPLQECHSHFPVIDSRLRSDFSVLQYLFIYLFVLKKENHKTRMELQEMFKQRDKSGGKNQPGKTRRAPKYVNISTLAMLLWPSQTSACLISMVFSDRGRKAWMLSRCFVSFFFILFFLSFLSLSSRRGGESMNGITNIWFNSTLFM